MKRRSFLSLMAAAATFGPHAALAFSEASARKLVGEVVDQINGVIASGKSETAMYRDFERILVRYGDMGAIAQLTLGADGRGVPAAEKRAYQEALQGYISRKYGKRFREFIGGQIEVVGVKKVNRYFEVNCLAKLRGQSPFEVDFMVSDRSGRELFFDLKIEGISLVRTEQREIGALLDKRRGNLSALTADLRGMG